MERSGKESRNKASGTPAHAPAHVRHPPAGTRDRPKNHTGTYGTYRYKNNSNLSARIERL